MRFAVAVLLVMMGVVGCATSVTQEPQLISEGRYTVKVTYGLVLDGDRESALRELDRQAARRCSEGYQVVSKDEHEREGVFGKNGQTDLTWVFECRPSDSGSSL